MRTVDELADLMMTHPGREIESFTGDVLPAQKVPRRGNPPPHSRRSAGA